MEAVVPLSIVMVTEKIQFKLVTLENETMNAC